MRQRRGSPRERRRPQGGGGSPEKRAKGGAGQLGLGDEAARAALSDRAVVVARVPARHEDDRRWMSRRTRSGWRDSIAVSALAPSSASPMTENPSASRIMRAQVRKLGWSSTMRTFVRGSMGASWQTFSRPGGVANRTAVARTCILPDEGFGRSEPLSRPSPPRRIRLGRWPPSRQLRPRRRAPSGVCPAEVGDSSGGNPLGGFPLANKRLALRGGLRSMPRVASSYSRA